MWASNGVVSFQGKVLKVADIVSTNIEGDAIRINLAGAPTCCWHSKRFMKIRPELTKDCTTLEACVEWFERVKSAHVRVSHHVRIQPESRYFLRKGVTTKINENVLIKIPSGAEISVDHSTCREEPIKPTSLKNKLLTSVNDRITKERASHPLSNKIVTITWIEKEVTGWVGVCSLMKAVRGGASIDDALRQEVSKSQCHQKATSDSIEKRMDTKKNMGILCDIAVRAESYEGSDLVDEIVQKSKWEETSECLIDRTSPKKADTKDHGLSHDVEKMRCIDIDPDREISTADCKIDIGETEIVTTGYNTDIANCQIGSDLRASITADILMRVEEKLYASDLFLCEGEAREDNLESDELNRENTKEPRDYTMDLHTNILYDNVLHEDSMDLHVGMLQVGIENDGIESDDGVSEVVSKISSHSEDQVQDTFNTNQRTQSLESEACLENLFNDDEITKIQWSGKKRRTADTIAAQGNSQTNEAAGEDDEEAVEIDEEARGVSVHQKALQKCNVEIPHKVSEVNDAEDGPEKDDAMHEPSDNAVAHNENTHPNVETDTHSERDAVNRAQEEDSSTSDDLMITALSKGPRERTENFDSMSENCDEAASKNSKTTSDGGLIGGDMNMPNETLAMGCISAGSESIQNVSAAMKESVAIKESAPDENAAMAESAPDENAVWAQPQYKDGTFGFLNYPSSSDSDQEAVETTSSSTVHTSIIQNVTGRATVDPYPNDIMYPSENPNDSIEGRNYIEGIVREGKKGRQMRDLNLSAMAATSTTSATMTLPVLNFSPTIKFKVPSSNPPEIIPMNRDLGTITEALEEA